MIEQVGAQPRRLAAVQRRMMSCLLWTVATAAVLLTGCASTSGGLAKDAPAAAKEAVVGARAKARWEALIRQDYAAAYDYFSPASRETVPLSKFQGQSRVVRYRAANVDKVVCEAEVCKVAITLTYDHAVMKGVVTPLEETWLIEGGQAWLVFGG